MKKLMFLAVLAMGLFSASFTFADDDINVDVSNESTNEVTATGGSAEQQQQMEQEQRQRQQQEACAIANPVANGGKSSADADANVIDSGNSSSTVKDSGNSSSTIKDSGNSTSDADANATAKIGDMTVKSETTVKAVEGDQSIENKNIYVAPENKRVHISAPAGPNGVFVDIQNAKENSWGEMVICDPFSKSFTVEELELMSQDVGEWFSSPDVTRSLRIKEVDDYDNEPIHRLDFIPTGPNDKRIGVYQFEAEEPMPLDAVLSYVLLNAKKDTNTHRFVFWPKNKIEFVNKSNSFGLGGVGSRLFGPNLDSTAGSFALGGIKGKSVSGTQEVYGVKIWVFNDGSIDPPAGMEVCESTVSAPMPAQPAPILEESVCDPNPILREIGSLEEQIRQCKNWGINNLRLRLAKGNAFVDLALCTGENGYFQEAIKDYQIAERNYLNGRDISANWAEADQLLAQVFFNWAGCVYELYGAESAADFAKSKNLSEFPNGFSK